MDNSRRDIMMKKANDVALTGLDLSPGDPLVFDLIVYIEELEAELEKCGG